MELTFLKHGAFSLLVLCVFTSNACKSNRMGKPVADNNVASLPYVLKYERGPCYGTCPVYAFYILNDHTGLVHAKANLLDTAGWYAADLDDETIAEILELIEPTAWWSPELGDQPDIADLPAHSLTYQHNSGTRQLHIKSRMNTELQNVFTKINHLVTESHWKHTTARPIELAIPEPTDVIVHLKPGVDINAWMKKYDSYGIHLKKKIAPNQQYYLIAKDPAKGVANDFLQHIKLDADVVNAQWDHKTELRE